MDLVMRTHPDEESAVVDFTKELLRAMGYSGRAEGMDLRSRKEISFLICGEWRHAKADVCVIGGPERLNEVLLVVQEDKRHMTLGDPHAQLVATAIAAVQYDNRMREQNGLDALDFKEMPGVVMIGTSPTFFKISDTRELIQAVQKGHYPATPTVVAMHRPQLPRSRHRVNEGMRPLDNRCIIVGCFEAFNQSVK